MKSFTVALLKTEGSVQHDEGRTQDPWGLGSTVQEPYETVTEEPLLGNSCTVLLLITYLPLCMLR